MMTKTGIHTGSSTIESVNRVMTATEVQFRRNKAQEMFEQLFNEEMDNSNTGEVSL